MHDSNETSNRLATARTKAGLTQREVAKRLQVTIGTIQAYEYNRANLTLHRAAQLAELYGVSLDWIAFGKDRHNQDPRLQIIRNLLQD